MEKCYIKRHELHKYTPIEIREKLSLCLDPCYGDIRRLSEVLYNSHQMLIMSLSLGDNFRYGNIEDLDPTKLTLKEAEIISLSRGEPNVQ